MPSPAVTGRPARVTAPTRPYPGAGDLCLAVVRGPQAADYHGALREGAGLVRRTVAGRAQRLNGRKPPDERA